MSSKKQICFVCKSDKDDEVYYGKFMKAENFYVHYYCLLLSSNLAQNGEDDEGVLGFLVGDIKKEERRTRSWFCCYCKEKNATIGCCHKQCFKRFHLSCAVKHKCHFIFYDTFPSYCDTHIKIRNSKKHNRTDKCNICYENMGDYHPITSISPPCCHNGFFHKRCIAQAALASGYFFKCPLCNNNSEEFKVYIKTMGIFIPEQDAAWEMEPNAFSDLLERPQRCEATSCMCRRGREYTNSTWSFIYCTTCGSKAIHSSCLGKNNKNNFICDVCQSVNPNQSANVISRQHMDTESDVEIESLCLSLSEDEDSMSENDKKSISELENEDDESGKNGPSSNLSDDSLICLRPKRKLKIIQSDEEMTTISSADGNNETLISNSLLTKNPVKNKMLAYSNKQKCDSDSDVSCILPVKLRTAKQTLVSSESALESESNTDSGSSSSSCIKQKIVARRSTRLSSVSTSEISDASSIFTGRKKANDKPDLKLVYVKDTSSSESTEIKQDSDSAKVCAANVLHNNVRNRLKRQMRVESSSTSSESEITPATKRRKKSLTTSNVLKNDNHIKQTNRLSLNVSATENESKNQSVLTMYFDRSSSSSANTSSAAENTPNTKYIKKRVRRRNFSCKNSSKSEHTKELNIRHYFSLV